MHDAERSKAFVPLTDEELKKALEAVPESCVLVGGQALAYWMAFYDVEFPEKRAVTIDADFLARSVLDQAVVKDVARCIGGSPKINPMSVISALIGTIEKDLGDGAFISLDFLHTLFKIDKEEVRKRSHSVKMLGAKVRVMDPLDVLESRLRNLHKLKEKQTEHGVAQLQCAIEVMKRLQVREALSWSDQGGLIEAITRLAREDAGRKVAKRFGVFIADAIVAPMNAPPVFFEKRWPQIIRWMSEDARKTIE